MSAATSSRLCLSGARLAIVLPILALLAQLALADQIKLSVILPKLQAIHEDARALLIKNIELKNKILVGLQEQNAAKIKQFKESTIANLTTTRPTIVTNNNNNIKLNVNATNVKPPVATKFNNQQQQQQSFNETSIDYAELEEFNKWVEGSLEYAVKNTQASAEALKEEAIQNNGNVDYSEQAIKDGLEGVKYWQSAVMFQDKTLKNEKYEPPSE